VRPLTLTTCYSHGFGEEAGNLLAAFVVPAADATLVELLGGAQFAVAASLDTLPQHADPQGVRGARGAIHHL